MKHALLAVCVLAFGMIISKPARPVIVECANCATFVDQLISNAKQAKQYLTEVATLQTTLNNYALMLRNSIALPQSIWADVQGDIAQVRNLANAASLLTGNSGTILNRLDSASGYANQAMNLPSNMGSQFTMWANTLGNSSRTLGRVAAVQQQKETQYAAMQGRINIHSQTAAGQMQAIQASNENLSLISTQLNQMQATNLAAAQEASTWHIVQADRRAFEDQALQRFVSTPEFSMNGWQRY